MIEIASPFKLLITSRERANNDKRSSSHSPRTTAFAPAMGTPVCLISSMQPCGVQGTNPFRLPIAVRPSLIVCKLCNCDDEFLYLLLSFHVSQKFQFHVPVHILIGANVIGHNIGVDFVRTVQRHLNDYAMDVRIVVQCVQLLAIERAF